MIFAVIPVIACLKRELDDNVLLRAVVSVVMACSVMELAKEDEQAGQEYLGSYPAARTEWPLLV